MAGELDTLDSQDIAPFDAGLPVLAPLSPALDTWGGTDLLREDQPRQPQGPAIFGSPLPVGTSKAQIDAVLGQLGGAFMADLSSKNYPPVYINAAISFMTANATKAPYQVSRQHNFNLHGHEDWLGNSFGNMVQNLSGSAKAKQGFVTACLQWLSKACKQLNTGTQSAPRTATPTKDPTENLSDRQYQQLVQHNNAVMAQTLATLERKWGACYKTNIELANAQLAKMTPVEIAHLDRYTGSWPWTAMLNTVECITFLYDSAVGAASIPQNGAGIAEEIAAFEAMLKVPAERARYMKDPQMQARLRELYARRGS